MRCYSYRMKKTTRFNTLATRQPLTRERILESALVLADKSGLDSVSMRNVAESLGVQAMSLYKHITNKDDLLDGLNELVAKQMTIPSENLGWKKCLKERAHSERNVLKLHPWVVYLFEARTGTGATRLHHQNHVIGILRRAGFPVELALNTMITQASYVYGFVILENAWSLHPKENSKARLDAPKNVQPSETEHPYVVEMIKFATAKRMSLKPKPPADFEFGLNLMLDSVEKALSKSRT